MFDYQVFDYKVFESNIYHISDNLCSILHTGSPAVHSLSGSLAAVSSLSPLTSRVITCAYPSPSGAREFFETDCDSLEQNTQCLV